MSHSILAILTKSTVIELGGISEFGPKNSRKLQTPSASVQGPLVELAQSPRGSQTPRSRLSSAKEVDAAEAGKRREICRQKRTLGLTPARLGRCEPSELRGDRACTVAIAPEVDAECTGQVEPGMSILLRMPGA